MKRWKHRGGISGRAWPAVTSAGHTSGEQRPPGEQASVAIRKHKHVCWSEEGKAKHSALHMCVLCHVSEVLSGGLLCPQAVCEVGRRWVELTPCDLRTREESGAGFRLSLYCA